GKHTLVEKPIAIDLAAADRMVSAAKRQGVLLMVGQVLPFFPEFRFAAECVAGGQYGKLLAAHFRRVISPPDWSEDMADFRKLGGWGVDLHIHDNHYISLLCGGPPRAVFSRGILQNGLVNHVHTQYVYDDANLAVSCVSGGIAAKGLQFAHGFELYLERATLVYNAGTLGGAWVVDRPLTLIGEDGTAAVVQLEGGEWYSAFTAELQTAVDAVQSRTEPRILSGELARDALRLCHAEAKSIAEGKAIEI
ncbi:MAG: Gfo/Idh/MocA family protein, partial [Planctomycetaceae bacterium]